MKALCLAGSAKELFLDVPDGNGRVAETLAAAGFSRCGSTELMVRGRNVTYRPAMIHALATMGSMG
jgi:hypothetical protein